MTSPGFKPTQTPKGSKASAPGSGAEKVFPEIPGFRIIQELGRSPSGIVFKGRRLIEQDIIAIKVLRNAMHNPDYWEHLKKNAEASFLLEHPGIVPSLGCIESDGRELLLMEYAHGEPLSRALQRNVRFQPARALNILLSCAKALQHAAQRKRHHGRLHPGDIILSEQENQIQMLGIGLGEHPEHTSWSVKDPHLFQPLAYAAPEAMPSGNFPNNTPDLLVAVDLFSLGSVLYHMLTGSTPFRGNDEGAIHQERLRIAPQVIRWPQGTEQALPPQAVRLVEKLLSNQPADRGTYDSLLEALKAAICEAEGQPAPLPPHATAVPVMAPAERTTTASGEQVPSATPAWLESSKALPALGKKKKQKRFSTRAALMDQQRFDRLSMPLLVGAVIFVFGFTAGMAVKTFFLTPTSKAPTTPINETKDTQPLAPRKNRTTNARNSGTEAPSAPSEGDADSRREQLAAKRLAVVKDMLASKDYNYSQAMLRILREVETQADPGGRTELATRLLIAKMEEKMAQQGSQPNRLSRQPTRGEEKVFQDRLTRAKELASEKRFGAAIRHMQDLPQPLRMAPFTDRAATAVSEFQQQAKAAFADTSTQAEKAVAKKDFAEARGLYQTIQARFGIKEWLDASAVRLRAIQNEADRTEKERLNRSNRRMLAKEQSKLSTGLLTVIPHAVGFSYDQAKKAMDKLIPTLKDPSTRRLAEDYAKLIQDEKWIFTRCQTRLKEAIARDGKSPIVVNNKNNKDDPGLEIIAFDQKGLSFTASRGRASGVKTRTWSTISPSQPIVMFRLLLDSANASEHMALSLLAFHRAARMQLAARNPAQKEATPDEWRKRAQDFKKMFEDLLNAAIQADTSARDRIEVQRKVMNRLYQLTVDPPEVSTEEIEEE